MFSLQVYVYEPKMYVYLMLWNKKRNKYRLDDFTSWMHEFNGEGGGFLRLILVF